MRTQTHMLNPNPMKCYAYHEAGHAVVGIINGLRLKYVTIRDPGGRDPHCRWDRNYINPILKCKLIEVREAFTEKFAITGLASRYSEAMSCDISSDEQRDSHHGDFGDAQLKGREASLDEFDISMAER